MFAGVLISFLPYEWRLIGRRIIVRLAIHVVEDEPDGNRNRENNQEQDDEAEAGTPRAEVKDSSKRGKHIRLGDSSGFK